MAVKTKTKKTQAKAKPTTRGKEKRAARNKSKPVIQAKAKKTTPAKPDSNSSAATEVVRVVNRISPPRLLPKKNGSALPRSTRLIPSYSYMKAPGQMHDFQVGDVVEVFCDHEKNRERVRGWLRGIVVQVDNKMVAVQFRSNVFLTDGWMVPDRILWYPLNSEHIRAIGGKKTAKKEKVIPEY
ncbi:MAG TPA: hypothetical protein VNK49_11905 [Anaerolineales bacterium]|nr:hypothetical protein [Anaerolineales bacterium]